MNYLRRVLLASAALCLVLMSSLPALAQLDTATITGTASDPSGAVIANAASVGRSLAGYA